MHGETLNDTKFVILLSMLLTTCLTVSYQEVNGRWAPLALLKIRQSSIKKSPGYNAFGNTGNILWDNS